MERTIHETIPSPEDQRSLPFGRVWGLAAVNRVDRVTFTGSQPA